MFKVTLRISILLLSLFVSAESFCSQGCIFIMSNLAVAHWTRHHALSSVWVDQAQVDSFNAFLSRLAQEGFGVDEIVIHDGTAYIGGKGYTGGTSTVTDLRPDAPEDASPQERVYQREVPEYGFQILALNLYTMTVTTRITPPVDAGYLAILDNHLLVFTGPDLLVYNRSDLKLIRSHEGHGHPIGAFWVVSPFNSHHILYRVISPGMGLETGYFLRYDWHNNTENCDLTAEEMAFLRTYQPPPRFAWPRAEDGGFRVETIRDGDSLNYVITFSDGTPTHRVTSQPSKSILSQLETRYPGDKFEQLPMGLFGNLLLLEYGSIKGQEFFGQAIVRGVYLPGSK